LQVCCRSSSRVWKTDSSLVAYRTQKPPAPSDRSRRFAWCCIDNLRRAGDGTRTRDIKLGRLALYQLSYSRVLRCYPPIKPAVLQW
jgi:hypothetical protein